MSTTSSRREVAPGVHRVCVAHTNCYLIVAQDGITLVDAGLPDSWSVLTDTLRDLGARVTDIDAVLLTHGHFDHVGLAHRLHRDHTIPVIVHPRDARLARHPYRYQHEAARLPYLFRPRALPVLFGMAMRGALGVRGVETSATVQHGHPVDVPGRPIALWTPGHTNGHCGFDFAEHGVLISGDALVTVDPYTGATGPRIVARAATADSDEALSSLDVLTESDAAVTLPGHGEPWEGSITVAVAAARRAGRS